MSFKESVSRFRRAYFICAIWSFSKLACFPWFIILKLIGDLGYDSFTNFWRSFLEFPVLATLWERVKDWCLADIVFSFNALTGDRYRLLDCNSSLRGPSDRGPRLIYVKFFLVEDLKELMFFLFSLTEGIFIPLLYLTFSEIFPS